MDMFLTAETRQRDARERHQREATHGLEEAKIRPKIGQKRPHQGKKMMEDARKNTEVGRHMQKEARWEEIKIEQTITMWSAQFQCAQQLVFPSNWLHSAATVAKESTWLQPAQLGNWLGSQLSLAVSLEIA